MAENSAIEWTDHTFNPWIGCTKVSPGCDGCYAEARMDTRLHRVQWGAGQPRQRTKTWGDPVRWNRQHEAFYATHGRRQRVFCASLADVFDNAVDPAWQSELFDLIRATPNLDWLLLTKRIGNVRGLMGEAGFRDWPNVWLGATIVNQEEADRDIPKLLATPARVRFLSMEPLLGPVDLRYLRYASGASLPESMRVNDEPCSVDALRGVSTWPTCHYQSPTIKTRVLIQGRDVGETRGEARRLDWVIVGGESGRGARPMHPAWARSLRDQCAAAGVPFLFKQWGEWLGPMQDGAFEHEPMELNASDVPVRVGKKAAGRRLDGREHNAFPEVR